MKKRGLSIFAIVICTIHLIAQNPLKMFQWRSHLSYENAYSITELSNRIYCAIAVPDPGNDPYYKQICQGLFYYDKGDNSYNRVSKVEGLSDVEPILVKSNPYNNSLFIAYDNANIDVIKNDVVINISDIKRKQILGNKKINSVTFIGKYAYTSTSLGIIVIDTDNGEIKESYVIGPGGSYLNVYECAVNNTHIFAATSSGLYYAPLNNTNLSNFQVWSREQSLPSGPFNSIVNFKGNIITNYSKYIDTGNTQLQDTLYTFNGTVWSEYPFKSHDIYSYTIKKIVADNAKNRIGFIDYSNIDVKDDAGNHVARMWGYSSSIGINANDLIFDSDLNYIWVADRFLGLTKCRLNTASSVPDTYERFVPNGPHTFLVNEVKIDKSKLVVAPVFLTDYPTPSYFQEGVYVFENDAWRHVRKVIGGPFFDINTVAFDPKDNNHLYAGSYGSGVLEITGDTVIAVFNNQNSPLPMADASSGIDTRVTSLETDEDGNLWVACAYSRKCINVRDAGGTWHTLQFGNSHITDQLIVDKNKQIWAVTLSPSIVLYKNDGSFANPSTANSFTLTTADAEGKISGSVIYCIAEDNEGDIWIGTNKGVFVIYDPESIVGNQSYTAQQIYIEVEGVTKILFETEDVSAIAADGANNKWVGTRKNGIFCISPDGKTELFHFTKENSPLFSNNIIDVEVNPENGEVFISTDKGMISFQNSVIEGLENYEDVYAYPNPVKPNYTGPVMIKGLINGSSLKITDAAGNFVYESTVEGGQAVWYAKNFKGERVASGIYLAMCATNDGSKKTVCKILVIN